MKNISVGTEALDDPFVIWGFASTSETTVILVDSSLRVFYSGHSCIVSGARQIIVTSAAGFRENNTQETKRNNSEQDSCKNYDIERDGTLFASAYF